MSIDQTKLGSVVAAQMEAIEGDHEGEECELGDIVVVVEVLCPESREVRVRSSSGSHHARIGLLAQALRNELA